MYVIDIRFIVGESILNALVTGAPLQNSRHMFYDCKVLSNLLFNVSVYYGESSWL